MVMAATETMDDLFRALADPTRRGVIERLGHGAASATELAAPFEMALPSFMQHMTVLERCGLVASRKRGRVRTYRLVTRQLKVAEDWLSRHRRLWEQRLNQLDDYLLKLKEKQ